jgi:hypothetical protein
MLFFENGNIMQPRYFASMPGIPEAQEQYSVNSRATTKQDGFRDPDGEYPVKGRLGEPDFHRLSRGVSDETLVTTKNQNRVVGVQSALGGQWSEPQSPFASQYPHNHVIATHGGITIELDSTPGSSRLHLYHPSNSFIEIDNDGNMVVKNNAEMYEIIAGGKNIYIKQQRNITIETESKKKIGTDEDIEIGGDKTEKVDGSVEEEISGSKEETIGGSLNISVTGNASITSPLITLNGNTSINGLLSALGSGGTGGTMSGSFTIQNGTITINTGNLVVNSGDVIADGVSLKNHVHSGVQSGGSNTGAPV